MKKIKKWYNKMLVKKYNGKNIDILEMLGEKRPFLFKLPLYSPSLYCKYKAEKVAAAFFDGFKSGFEQASTPDKKFSKEIQKSFGTEIDQVFIDDWGFKKKGE